MCVVEEVDTAGALGGVRIRPGHGRLPLEADKHDKTGLGLGGKLTELMGVVPTLDQSFAAAKCSFVLLRATQPGCCMTG